MVVWYNGYYDGLSLRRLGFNSPHDRQGRSFEIMPHKIFYMYGYTSIEVHIYDHCVMVSITDFDSVGSCSSQLGRANECAEVQG